LATQNRNAAQALSAVNDLERRMGLLEKRVAGLEYWLSNNDWRRYQVHTTDATETTCGQAKLYTGAQWLFEAAVVALSSGGDSAFYHLEGAFYGAAGGVATQMGHTFSHFDEESDTDWDCDFDVDGQYVRVRVTGEAATSIDWKTFYRYRELST